MNTTPRLVWTDNVGEALTLPVDTAKDALSGKPADTGSGVFLEKWTYDSSGRVIEQQPIDPRLWL